MRKGVSDWLLVFAGMLLLSACASDGLKIKSVSPTSGNAVDLGGTLYKPEGAGPFPAVVLLHRCGGTQPWDHAWATRLKSFGYAALVLDSFGSRYISEACTRPGVLSLAERAMDAHSAKSFLASLPFIDPKRIAVMGWSYGGQSTLCAINPTLCDPLPLADKTPFRAAVAFYPNCQTELGALNAPLLILIGEKDDWTPAQRCVERKPPEGKGRYETIVKVYPGASHCFDCTGVRSALGHYMAYDGDATSDSIEQVRAFLTKHMN